MQAVFVCRFKDLEEIVALCEEGRAQRREFKKTPALRRKTDTLRCSDVLLMACPKNDPNLGQQLY